MVTGPAKGRWRAGRHFGPEPVVIPASELTEAQARALADDPELTMMPAGSSDHPRRKDQSRTRPRTAVTVQAGDPSRRGTAEAA